MFAQIQKCMRGFLACMAFEKVRFPGMLQAQHSFVWMHRYYTGRYVQKLLQSSSGTHGALSVALRSAESYVLRSWLRHLRCCNWLHVTGTSVDRNLPLRPNISAWVICSRELCFRVYSLRCFPCSCHCLCSRRSIVQNQRKKSARYSLLIAPGPIYAHGLV
jgi:hypothetical protein